METAALELDTASSSPRIINRRQVLRALGALGVGGAVFQRAVAAQAEGQKAVTADMIQQAEWIAGIELSDEDRKSTAQSVNQTLRDCEALRKVKVDASLGVWEQFIGVRDGQIENPSPPEVGLRMAKLWDAIKASAAKNGVPVRCG